MQSRAIAKNLNLRNLLSGSSLQPLKIFARENAAMPVTHLQNQQIEPRSWPIRYIGYSWFIR
jgi:hypothetical protein